MVSLLRFAAVGKQTYKRAKLLPVLKSFFFFFLDVQVHDRRHEEFILRKPNKRFPGVGQAIYGDVSAPWCSHHTNIPKVSYRFPFQF